MPPPLLWAQMQILAKIIPDSIFLIFDKKNAIFNFDEKLIWGHFLPTLRYAEYEFNIPGAQK